MKYAVLFLLCGCSFKESVPVPTTEPKAETVTVSWQGDKDYSINRALAKEGVRYFSNVPITLSSPVPQVLAIEGSLPLTSSVYVESVSASRDGNSYALAGSYREGRLEITGLRSVLTDEKDQRLDLLLRAKNTDGGSPWTLELTLLTLPTALSFSALPISDFPAMKKLVSPNLRIDLLRVVKFKNDKKWPVALKTGSRWIIGHLERHYTTYEVIRYACAHAINEHSSTEFHKTEFAFLPLTETLPEKWINILYDGGNGFVVAPGEEITLGLYGYGSGLATYVDQGVPAVVPATTEAVSYCQEKDCIGPRERLKLPVAGRCFGGGPVKVPVREGTLGHEVRIVFESNSNHVGLTYPSGIPSENNPARSIELFPTAIPLF